MKRRSPGSTGCKPVLQFQPVHRSGWLPDIAARQPIRYGPTRSLLITVSSIYRVVGFGSSPLP